MAVQGSRFFAGGDSSSSDESSSEDEEIIQAKTVARQTFQWSDDEEDTKRVVRSEKEKRWEEMKGIIKTMKNHTKIKDMPSIQSDFEDLCRCYDKSKKVIEKEGIPRFFIRCMSELDTFINECWEDREWRKTLNKSKDKVLRELRQRLKRYFRDSAKIESAITAFRESPDQGDDDEEEEPARAPSDDDDENDATSGVNFAKSAAKADKAARAPAKEKRVADDESGSDDGLSFTEDESSSEESSDDGGAGITRDWFLKRREDDGKKEKKEKKVRPVPKKRLDDSEDEADGAEWQQVVAGGGSVALAEKPKIFAKDTEITIKAVVEKLHEFVLGRGKKGTDRMLMVEQLIELRSIATEHKLGLAIDVKIVFGIIGAIYDYNPNIASCMKDDMWKKCTGYIQELLEILANNGDQLELTSDQDAVEAFEGDEGFVVRGNILHVIERLDEEYVKMLQACDAHSTEYVDRLRDEPVICKIIEDLQSYLAKIGASRHDTCRVYQKRIEHLYYKFDLKAQDESLQLMDSLCKFIYDNDNTDRVRTRAMLCQIYHLALHNQWFNARDLMLMSHLQDNINSADVPTQIMYNRAMVQLGLCAFRKGMIKDAHNCLVDIQSSGRAKELLAQGLLLQRQNERTAEQEKIEKRRQVPFHMHINLELIECVYLVSAMLIEIPYMAAHEFDARRRMISKNFHHVLRVSDRQPLLGPPESMREHLVAASKAMKAGNWKDCYNYVINEKMNAKVWDLFHDADSVKTQLSEKIKVESLRTYLFTYSSIYDSVSLPKLAQMHDLDLPIVHSTVSKMIINDELAASMDEPSQCAIMHRTDPTRLQSLALQLSEKVQNLVDCNEKLWEMKSGNFSFQRQHNQGHHQHGGDYGHGHGHGHHGHGQHQRGYRGNRYNQDSNRRDGNRRDRDNRD